MKTYRIHLTLACAVALVAGAMAQPVTTYTLAGRPTAGASDGFRHKAQFNCPGGVTVDPAGNLYVADTGNSVIRKVDVAGAVTTLAGQPGEAGSLDGLGTNAQFNVPQGIACDVLSGDLYVADTGNHTIRRITPFGLVSTVAGAPGQPNSLDGPCAEARFNHPEALAADASGNLYVADTWNHVIRKVTPAGSVTTIAGLAGNAGAADGVGQKARFNRPAGVAVDPVGNVYVADFMNHTIRRITPAGEVGTIAGASGLWGSRDGAGPGCRFYHPQGVAVAGANELVVLDSGNHTLRRVLITGTTGVTETMAGAAGVAAPYDGTGAGAQFFFPAGVAAGSSGLVYIADSGNNSVRTDRVVPPWLEQSEVSGQLTLRWPVSFLNFDLETATVLAPGSWSAVQLPVEIQGDYLEIRTNLAHVKAFYRLRQR